MNNQHTPVPVTLESIHIEDPFWNAYHNRVIDHMIPYQWQALNDQVEGAEKSHCMENFRIAAGLSKGDFHGFPFQDSDFSKWIEAVGYALMIRPNPALETIADEAIDLVVSAQQDDGYLDTYYIINGLDKRFTDLTNNHELYCLGHMIEGAISYYQATGKDKFLQAAIRFTECVRKHIGPEEGKHKGYPGHELVEMALMRLYYLTGDTAHLSLAKYFIDQRGQRPLYFPMELQSNSTPFKWADSPFQYQYYQAGLPVREQTAAEGHAVRAVYLYSGMADVAMATNDEPLFNTVRTLWQSIVTRRMYITGGIGSTHYGESFTFDYDLPNDTIYAETCAAIGLVFLARRMLQYTLKASYADVMERALLNGVISGMSLDGEHFFYVNPLEVVPEACRSDHLRDHVKVTRQKWFGCACCPPNLARLLTSIGSYAYVMAGNTLYFNLYIGGRVDAQSGDQRFMLDVQSGFPWHGNVIITVQDVRGTLALRIPGWCRQHRILVNNAPVEFSLKDGYAHITRDWQPGDTISLSFDMSVTVVAANPHVRENIGKLAVMRGPIVYCLEEADNGDQLHRIRLDRNTSFVEQFRPDLLDGVVTLVTQGRKLSTAWDESSLYQPARDDSYTPVTLTFIPYYAWANRTQGEMTVWVRQAD